MIKQISSDYDKRKSELLLSLSQVGYDKAMGFLQSNYNKRLQDDYRPYTGTFTDFFNYQCKITINNNFVSVRTAGAELKFIDALTGAEDTYNIGGCYE